MSGYFEKRIEEYFHLKNEETNFEFLDLLGFYNLFLSLDNLERESKSLANGYYEKSGWPENILTVKRGYHLERLGSFQNRYQEHIQNLTAKEFRALEGLFDLYLERQKINEEREERLMGWDKRSHGDKDTKNKNKLIYKKQKKYLDKLLPSVRMAYEMAVSADNVRNDVFEKACLLPGPGFSKQ